MCLKKMGDKFTEWSVDTLVGTTENTAQGIQNSNEIGKGSALGALGNAMAQNVGLTNTDYKQDEADQKKAIDDLMDELPNLHAEDPDYATVAAQKERDIDASNRRRRRRGHLGTILTGPTGLSNVGNVGKTILGG